MNSKLLGLVLLGISTSLFAQMQMPTKNSVSIETMKLGESSAPLKNYVLTAQVVTQPGGPDLYTYNGTVPGPVIHVQQGDHLHVTLINKLPVATTIHWHGIAVPPAADGASGVTQDAVKPGETFEYDFIAREPGTYWYHSHQDTANQVPRGLFGALIVDPTGGTGDNNEPVLVFHDQRGTTAQTATKRAGQHARLVNGNESALVAAKTGDKLRVRIVNALAGDMTGAPLRIALVGTAYRVVALDGHDINQPQAISANFIELGNGQRADLEFTMPADAVKILDLDNQETVTIGVGQLPPIGDVSTFHRFDPTTYGSPLRSQIPPTNFDLDYTITLGEHPGFRQGRKEFIHTMNGEAFPDTPMLTVQLGQLVHLHLINQTNEYHPIHLHGHILTILNLDGSPVVGSPLQMDTVLVAPKQTADVAFLADNPGLWMLHCHVLIHAAFGMDMMVMYPNITTPFQAGSESGNLPD
jgi:FtsP/CotA-like multicopper oxidase with cupredoxin domain